MERPPSIRAVNYPWDLSEMDRAELLARFTEAFTQKMNELHSGPNPPSHHAKYEQVFSRINEQPLKGIMVADFVQLYPGTQDPRNSARNTILYLSKSLGRWGIQIVMPKTYWLTFLDRESQPS